MGDNQRVYLPPYEVHEIMFQPFSEYIDWGAKAIEADKVWSEFTGKGFKVAVLDTGADLDHPDLRDNIADFANFTSEKNANDEHGHGSHCSGIIAASKNKVGIIGVAPEAHLYIGKVLDNNGGGNMYSVHAGLQWAYDKGVDVVSMSLGLPGQLEDVDPEILKLFKALRERGTIVCVAAGNMGHDPKWGETINMLARSEDVLGIAALNSQEKVADFSSRGKDIDYAMPGVNIYSCYKNGQYATMSGTSMATPYAAGACVLMMQRFEKENGRRPTFDELRAEMNKHAKDIGVTGSDDLSGMGLVHLESVFEKAPAPAKKYWRVQLGAFSNLANAVKFRDTLRAKGISAIVKRVPPYFKVQVGAFSVEDNARRYCDYIKSLGYKDAFVVYY